MADKNGNGISLDKLRKELKKAGVADEAIKAAITAASKNGTPLSTLPTDIKKKVCSLLCKPKDVIVIVRGKKKLKVYTLQGYDAVRDAIRKHWADKKKEKANAEAN